MRAAALLASVRVFSATFIYALAAIGWVERGGAGHAPFISTWIVIALLLASVGVFVALIDKLSLLQLNRTLAFTASIAVGLSSSVAGRPIVCDYPVNQTRVLIW